MNIVELTALTLVAIGMIVLGVAAIESRQAERASRPERQQDGCYPKCGR